MDASLRQRHAAGLLGGQPADPSGDRRSSSAHTKHTRMGARGAPACFHLLPLLVFAFFLICTACTYYRHTSLPSPLSAAATPSSHFSEERARRHVRALTDFGVRVTGSVPNEIRAVRYILETLSDIRRDMSSIDSGGCAWDFEVSLTHPTGTFDLDFLGGFTSAYVGVTNIAARLTPRVSRFASQPPNATALLVSAHFDSALGTVAATDDVANIANMLEVLRALVHRPSLPSALIFLFNGAEETVLQASHGFITQHAWASSISAFVNLEGAGGSGRELVFQTGPRNEWIARAYSQAAPYPFFSIVGQDIFQSGLIPSDTDFRIYRDYGDIPGLDAAYISNGYVYHTALDTYDQVNPGSMQRCGENLLATVTELTNSPLLILTHRQYQERCPAVQVKRGGNVDRLVQAHTAASVAGGSSPLTRADYESILNAGACLDVRAQQEDSAVYFDVLGLIVLYYSARTAQYVNWLAAAIVAVYLAKQEILRRRRAAKEGGPKRTLMTHFGVTLLSFLVGILAPVTIGLALAFTTPMQWFARPWLVFGLFSAPGVLVYASVQRRMMARKKGKDAPAAVDKKETDLVDAFACEELAYDSACLFWLLLLVVLTVAQVGSAFLALVFCILPLFGRSMGRWVEQGQALLARPPKAAASSPAKGWLFLSGYLLGLVLPVVLLSQANVVTIEFFLPLMGRAGTVAPSDAVQGALCSLLVLFTCFMGLSCVHLCVGASWRYTRAALLAVFVLALALSLVNSATHGPASAYSATTPKRLFLLDIERVVHPRGSDSFRAHPEFAANAAAAAAPGVQLLPRSAHRSTLKPVDRGIWLITMDFLRLKPLAGLRVSPQAIGRQANDSSVGVDGRVDLMSAVRTLACPTDASLNEATLFCDLPYILPLKDLLPGAGWIALPPTALRSSIPTHTVELTRVDQLAPLDGFLHHRRLHFRVRDVASHMTLYVNNRPEFSRVVAWSFGHSVATSAKRGQPTLGPQYETSGGPPEELFVFFAGGSPGAQDALVRTEAEFHALLADRTRISLEADFLRQERTWEFWLETADAEETVRANTERGREPLYVDFSIAAHHLAPQKNEFMANLQREMPDWTAPIVFTSLLAQFQF